MEREKAEHRATEILSIDGLLNTATFASGFEFALVGWGLSFNAQFGS